MMYIYEEEHGSYEPFLGNLLKRIKDSIVRLRKMEVYNTYSIFLLIRLLLSLQRICTLWKELKIVIGGSCCQGTSNKTHCLISLQKYSIG